LGRGRAWGKNSETEKYTLQHTATHFHTLQHTATHFHTLQQGKYCDGLQTAMVLCTCPCALLSPNNLLTRTRTRTNKHSRVCASLTHLLAHSHACTRARTHTQTRIHALTYTHIHKHTKTNTYNTHKRAHTHMMDAVGFGRATEAERRGRRGKSRGG